MPLIIALLLVLLSQFAAAQELTGHVKDNKGFPVGNATVVLFNAKDSSLIDLTISQENGDYVFPTVKQGHYFVRICRIGYQHTNSAVFVTGISDYALGGTALQPAALKKIPGSLEKGKLALEMAESGRNFSAMTTDDLELFFKLNDKIF